MNPTTSTPDYSQTYSGITVPDVIDSNLLSSNKTLQDVIRTRERAERDQRRLQEQLLQASRASTEEENLARELAQANTAYRNREAANLASIEEINRNEPGRLTSGVQNAVNISNEQARKDLTAIALKRLAASDSLSALTGVRQSKVESLKSALGFEDKRIEKYLGIEDQFKQLSKNQRSEARDTILKTIEFYNGKDWNDLTPIQQQDLTNVAANGPLTVETIKSALANNKVAYQDKQRKESSFELSPGQTRYQYNPSTGQVEAIASAPRVAASNTVSGTVTKPLPEGSPVGPATTGYVLDILRQSSGGKALTGEQTKPISKAQTVLGQINTLYSTINNTSTGPILGIIKSNNPYDTKAQLIKAQLQAIVPNLARGVYGEVGVLTDNDIANYSSTLPNLRSTKDVSDAILAVTLETIQRSVGDQLETLAASGRDVSGFENIYRRLDNQVTTLKEKLNSSSQSAPLKSGYQGRTTSGVGYRII